MSSRNRKLVPYRRPLKINIEIAIFGILFVYLCFSASSYLGREKVRFYEVVTGEMADIQERTGLILRTENVQTAPSSGYVNYYIRDGRRAAVGSRIYLLDETGDLKKQLDAQSGREESLSSENLKELKMKLSSFSVNYRGDRFEEVYNSRDAINSVLSEYASLSLLDQLDETLSANGISFTQGLSPESAVVSFNIDSYEGKTAEQLTADDFRTELYKPSYARAGTLVESGAPVYKTIPSEDWELVFPLSEEERREYADRKSLRALFPGRQLTLAGDYRETTGADGAAYGVLTFHQYMVRFLNDRFLKFQIHTGSEDGLKIPRSSIAAKRFFVVPKSYLTNGGNGVEEGFLKEAYDGGEIRAVFTPAEIFYAAEESYYLDASETAEFRSGDYLIAPQSNDRFQVGETAELSGVYNINKGFAVFKQIDIIDENDEYVTVRRGTKYGLNVYDHILLDGQEGAEGQPVYR